MTTSRTAYWREYARKNPDKIRAKKAAYRARNKAKIAAYRAKNKAKIAAQARAYREAHADEPRTTGPSRLELLRERFAAYRAAKQAAA